MREQLESSNPFSPTLEAKLTAFLDAAPRIKETLAGISDWQIAHSAEHRALEERLNRDTKSYHFRISTLEATAGRGWIPAVRMALLIALAAFGGYAAHATKVSSVPAAAASAVR